jgi:hypothetical protein
LRVFEAAERTTTVGAGLQGYMCVPNNERRDERRQPDRQHDPECIHDVPLDCCGSIFAPTRSRYTVFAGFG